MCLKVIIILMTLCGTSFEYRLPKQPMQSYNILEMPLFNRFNFNITPKTTAVPVLFSSNIHALPLKSPYLKEIQYAPLHEPRSNKRNHFARKSRPTPTTKHFTSNTQASSPAGNYGRMYSKDHLEPRLDFDSANQNKSYKCPGHKVHVFTAVSRSPGHNAIYRSFPQVPRDQSFNPAQHVQDLAKKSINPSQEEFENIHNMKPDVYQSLQVLSATRTPFNYHMRNLQPVAIINDKDDVDVINLIDLGNSKLKHQPPPTYNKFHRVHLNIARIYNPRQLKQQALPFVHT